MAQLFIASILVFHTLTGLSNAQLPTVWKPDDVVTYFCSRWYHQSVVKNDVLYVYGGVQTFNEPNVTVSSTNNTLGYNPYVIEVDLQNAWDWKKNLSWLAFERRENPKTGALVRHAMVNGAMFHGPYNTTNVWTYSGTTFRGNESFLDSNFPYGTTYPLWSFDNATQSWDQFDLGQLKTPSYGLSAEASDQGLAFYLNGQIDNGTDPDTWENHGDTATLLNGMMVIDLVHQTAKNISTTSMTGSQPRVGGAMQYVPGIGDSGLLVALGGKVYDGLLRTTSQTKGRLLTFDTVDVFDLASYLTNTKSSGTWYQQPTSGEVPPPRIDTCTVVASAPDNSTHNIYIYGGWDPTSDQTWYDDIYVLSLPSFTWIKMYQAESPRYGHTCHLVGRQMLTVGGLNIRRNITDMCDWETQSIAVIDLPTMTWGSIFNASNARYELSNGLVDKLGGTPQGGGLRLPAKGWSSPKFGTMMNTTRIYSNLNGTLEVIRPTPVTSGLSSSTRTAVIAGATVAGVVLIACIIWLFYLYRKRRNLAPRIELSGDDGRHSRAVEIDEKDPHELSPEEKKVFEMNGEEWRYEAPDTLVRAEADEANVTSLVVELPTTNFGNQGRWGVPIIKEPTPNASRRGSATAGIHSVRVSSRRCSADMV